MKKRLKIITIFLAFNASQTLEKFYHDFPKNLVDEIILVDDYSTDKTVEVAKSFGAIILKNGSKDNETGRKIKPICWRKN